MRLKLLFSFFLIALVSIGSVVIAARATNAREVRSFMFGGGMYGLGSIATQLESYYAANGTWVGAEALLDTSMHGGGRGQGSGGMMGGMGLWSQRLRLADASGSVVVDTGSSAATGKLSAGERSSSVVLKVGGKTVGYLLPEGGVPYTSNDEKLLLNRLNRPALTAAVVAGIASLALALLFAYGLLRPVRELTQASARLARGDLSQRVPVRGSDEIASLGETFNHMAESLERAEATRRGMTADIAHELRNPLAVQRASLEAMQDGVYPLTTENLEQVLEQNRLLSRLVEDLRTLALADAGQLTLERAPTDLPALVRGVVERFTPAAAARQVRLDLDLPAAPTVPISLDPMRIEQILGNLLSNALRHTPEGGQIHLKLASTPGAVSLSVRDSGPGIPAEALPHLFERFYRADKARSREAGGSGLGLAIARQLAEAHGATLTAANHPEGGAVFTLMLVE
jgi:two-component system OmpR family sensor kinase/two-component system sensor histidine kinase BaeS